MLLFLEYDFTTMYKLGRTHVVTYALSKLPNITNTIGVPNQTTYASLFHTKLEWLNDVKDFFENETYWGHVISIV